MNYKNNICYDIMLNHKLSQKVKWIENYEFNNWSIKALHIEYSIKIESELQRDKVRTHNLLKYHFKSTIIFYKYIFQTWLSQPIKENC